MEFVAWLENTGFSTWIRESECICAYDTFLAAHAIGMALVVGVSAGLALRILGLAKGLPLAALESYFPVVYGGFWVNAGSGALLLVAYPTRAVTNPVFWLKLTGVTLAVLSLRRVRRLTFGPGSNGGVGEASPSAKLTAMALLFSWWGAIVAGRLLAYHDAVNIEIEHASAVAIVALSGLLLAGALVAGRALGWTSEPHSAGR